ncbi:unnamed protein product, partial [Mesorhabditis belari]|uniref:GDP-fucose protein O-fucosyltransferase 2 n=1 Tax=Mesorhabditis belari TaxID=2138241 RepID=A0AAF3FFS0_9BILA
MDKSYLFSGSEPRRRATVCGGSPPPIRINNNHHTHFDLLALLKPNSIHDGTRGVIRRARTMRHQPDGYVRSFVDNQLITQVDDDVTDDQLPFNTKCPSDFAKIDIVAPNELAQLGVIIPKISDPEWSAPIREATSAREMRYRTPLADSSLSAASLDSPSVRKAIDDSIWGWAQASGAILASPSTSSITSLHSPVATPSSRTHISSPFIFDGSGPPASDIPCTLLQGKTFEGWLRRRKTNDELLAAGSIQTNKWPKCWMALRAPFLYVYPNQFSKKADLVISVLRCAVTDATDLKTSKKFVFRIHRGPISHYFSCYTQNDMKTWMHKIIVAIEQHSLQPRPPIKSLSHVESGDADVDSGGGTPKSNTRYLIYDVNPGEGFNLRRDVYMRVANAVRTLREKGEDFVLVLPPWGGLYHWGDRAVRLPWSTFFDTRSMARFVPVIEFDEFLQVHGNDILPLVIYLQHYKEGWGEHYEMKWDKRECLEDAQRVYRRDTETKKWRGWFFSYSNILANRFKCISFQGDSNTFVEMIMKDYPNEQVLYIDRLETVMHADFGDREYWRARRSMRYAPHLTYLGDIFRKEKLQGNDVRDGTQLPDKWETKKEDEAKGGPYICLHWRRKDFVRAHGDELPSIKGTAKLIKTLTKQYSVSRVFLSTDAPIEEIYRLQDLVKGQIEIITYENEDLGDGEIAIIHQYICSKARFFTGSHVSTFSFRIAEDREILNFPASTTFNRMCPDGNKDCEQPTHWKIKY